MLHHKSNFQKKNKFNKAHLSKSSHTKISKTIKNINNKTNNITALKRSLSGVNCLISHYDNDFGYNKTITLDNKSDIYVKNKSFVSSSELSKRKGLLSKKDKKVNENKYLNEILSKSSLLNINKPHNVIKVNVKIGKDFSPSGSSKISNNDSCSKNKINYNTNDNSYINLFNKNASKKISGDKHNIKNIKYTISFTQKKFFQNEKVFFFIMKIKKTILKKYFQLIKMKLEWKNKKYKKNSNLKTSENKHKLKLNLSSNKKTKPKNFDTNKINKNYSLIFKQTKNNVNPRIIYGNIGLNRPPSQLSIKPSNDNINQSLFSDKQTNVKRKINKNTLLNNSKKSKNNTKYSSIDKINNKQKINNSKNKNNDKKNKISKIKISKSKESKNLIKNEGQKILKLNKSNNDNYINIKGEEDIKYCNTEISSKIINLKSRTCKVYENCLCEKNNYFRTKFIII
jgi:hypothetical protein